MRTSSCLALLTVPCAMLACTALLGDFTVGPSDGGGDANAGDASDAGDGSTLFELACTEGAKTARIQVTQDDSLNAQQLRMAVMPTSDVRVVVANYVPTDAGGNNNVLTLQAYTVDLHNQNQITPATLPTAANQAFAIERYSDTDTGFAVLYIQYDNTMSQNFLWVARLSDNQTAWNPPVELVPVGNNNNNLEADFTVINSVTDDYFIVFSTVDATNQTIMGGEVIKGNSNTLASIATFSAPAANRNAFDIVQPGVAYRASRGYAMLSPTGNSGPPPVGAPASLVESNDSVVTLTPPMNLNYFPTGFGNAVDPTKVNAAFLTANLTTLTGQYGIGQVAVSSLATFDPSMLPPTIPTAADGGAASLKDLFVGGGGSVTAHWEIANLLEQFIMAGPTLNPATQTYLGGVNFGWWDATSGSLRAYAAGDGNLVGDIPFINSADATITGLVGSIGQVELAYFNAVSMPTNNGNQPVASDLWLTAVACIKK